MPVRIQQGPPKFSQSENFRAAESRPADQQYLLRSTALLFSCSAVQFLKVYSQSENFRAAESRPADQQYLLRSTALLFSCSA
ncbi:hypothetical protein K8S19_11935, partial [bacterium]|nr:hypothetical protein [bacterium]